MIKNSVTVTFLYTGKSLADQLFVRFLTLSNQEQSSTKMRAHGKSFTPPTATFWCDFLFYFTVIITVKQKKNNIIIIIRQKTLNFPLNFILKCYNGGWIFKDNFSAEKPWHNIIWNNKDICINNRPVFCKTFWVCLCNRSSI